MGGNQKPAIRSRPITAGQPKNTVLNQLLKKCCAWERRQLRASRTNQVSMQIGAEPNRKIYGSARRFNPRNNGCSSAQHSSGPSRREARRNSRNWAPLPSRAAGPLHFLSSAGPNQRVLALRLAKFSYSEGCSIAVSGSQGGVSPTEWAL